MKWFVDVSLQLQDRKVGDETQYCDAGKLIKHSTVIIFSIDTMYVYLFATLSGAAFSQFSLTQISTYDDVI